MKEIGFTMESCSTEEMVFSVESQKAVPAPFLTKTYQLVDDILTDHIVSWSHLETSFVVWRPSEFARDLLPNYFKHNNFSSFVRQLNTYGFKKVTAERWEFANEYFKKGAKHLLCEIHRRKNPQHQQQYFHYHQDQPAHYLTPENHSFGWIDPPLPSAKPSTDILTTLSQDNQRLRRRNCMLLSELSHMKTLYNDIIYFIQNHVETVPYYRYHKACNASHNKLVELDSTCKDDQTVSGTETTINLQNVGRLNLAHKESHESVKLFGVSLSGMKRLQPEVVVDTQEL
ncbi:hypothetical protein K2173_016775 [Erythroxylum novogranatense]|uniref:HSF-type DNA-binding domain-containing protein n=1 Tax=Erythroxylum novogranatense TaxID=1862640 RepID=A0AAV8SH70_9ROSI|nr:hypothetical protein K2173_016775 [Erythroxylum novogranatense]